MKEQIVTLLSALLVALIGFAVTVLQAWKTNLKNKAYTNAISALEDAVKVSVKSLQSQVMDLKDPTKRGVWNDESMKSIRDQAVSIALLMARPAVLLLESKFDLKKSDITKMIISMVESSVWDDKRGSLTLREFENADNIKDDPAPKPDGEPKPEEEVTK